MKHIEKNIINSFRLAKTDIIRIQKTILDISKKQKEIIEKLDTMKANQTRTQKRVTDLSEKVRKQKQKIVKKKAKPSKKVIVKKVVQKVARKRAQTYLASKDGKKFHIPACPFAQNIKPKFKIPFKTKTKALNMGYKPCSCIK